MNKKVMIGIGIVFIAAIFVVVGIIIPNNKNKEEGKKELEITIESSGGVPYVWEYEIDDKSIVEFVKTVDTTPEEDKRLEGGPVYTNYVFKGVKEGKTDITFRYVSIDDKSIVKEMTYTVKVDKNNNISLKGK